MSTESLINRREYASGNRFHPYLHDWKLRNELRNELKNKKITRTFL